MMKDLPKVALVGRPNVGKSALFNRLCNKRISIVDEEEGVTRDRLHAMCDFFGTPFCLIDTGGIDPASKRVFHEEVQEQTAIAIQEADRLIMVVDVKVGVTNLDMEIAKKLKKLKKPLILAVNKIDQSSHLQGMHEFHKLGISKMVGISAVHGFQIAELLEIVFTNVQGQKTFAGPKNTTKLAIVGRSNVGKSTLLNAFLDEQRSLVSPIAGTTRDAIYIERSFGEKNYLFIDTAGLRKKQKEQCASDKFATVRTCRAIEEADICLLVLDAEEGVSAYDKKIASLIRQKKKGAIFLMNKWDLVSHMRQEQCLAHVREILPSFERYPILFISAKKRKGLNKIFETVEKVEMSMQKRIPTAELNQFIEQCQKVCHPPMIEGKRLRIYYLTQIDVSPPEFVLFVNNSRLLMRTYKRYLINQFQKTYEYIGTPLLFRIKGKKTLF